MEMKKLEISLSKLLRGLTAHWIAAEIGVCWSLQSGNNS